MAADSVEFPAVHGPHAHAFEAKLLPVLYHEADRASSSAQRWYLRLLFAELAALVAAAVGGASGQPWSRGLALWAFVFATLLHAWSMRAGSERAWFTARALAESIKSLAWQFAVRGGSFDNGDSKHMFRAGVQVLQTELKPLPSGLLSSLVEITPTMLGLRDAEETVRHQTYRAARLETQLQWYGRKARTHAKWSGGLGFAVLGLEIIGVALAIWNLEPSSLDFLGIFSAGIAGVTAWLAARQHTGLVNSYSLAARELRSLVLESEARASAPGSETWAAFVSRAENAISREHKTWVALRGGQPEGR